MDFLDPRKRHRHDIFLMVGYVLTGIAILLTSIILIYGASGYGLNKKGNVIQNGLLFVDSKPSGADILLNGKKANSPTSARLVLPAGGYSLAIKKTGYRDWSRDFTLNENSISRFVYPFLFPKTLVPKDMKIYGFTPGMATESLDKHWLLVQDSAVGILPTGFEMFDLTKLSQPPVALNIPSGLLNPAGPHQLKVVEWASNNQQILLEHDWAGGSEFIVYDRIDPITSFNVNQKFGVNPTKVSLKNKKVDQLYLFDLAAKTLVVGDSARASIQPLLKDVLAYKSHGSDLISYVTDQKVAPGQVMARIWENGKTYPLYTFPASGIYLLDIAQFQDHWYYVAGGDSARINIYKDPLSGIKDPQTAKAIPLIALPNSGANVVGFSDNSRFVEVEAGQKFAVYDIETKNRFQYDLKAPLSGNLHWMDGHRLIGLSNGSVFVMDYDGINQQSLIAAANEKAIFFDRDFNQLLTFNGPALSHTDLRAGADLPKASQ